MNKQIIRALAAIMGSGSLSFVQAQSSAAAEPSAPPVVDAASAYPKQDDGQFLQRHEAFLARGRSGPVGLLFLGDSITQAWDSVPGIWDASFGRYAPANFGIGGNQTQNVIWQIENGELDGIKPRVVVLLVGTNNTATHTGSQIAGAVNRIISLVQAQQPQARVLLLAVFPRGPRKNKDGTFDDGVQRMKVIADLNGELAKLADGIRVRFLDIGNSFLGPDGKIPLAIMPDQLHLSPAGYRIWADAMQPTLTEMLDFWETRNGAEGRGSG